jgi:hypothetical protein
MNRKKVIQALLLLNVAVVIAALIFLPRQTGYMFFSTSEFERQIKHIWYSTPWVQVFWTLCVSALVSVAIYKLLDGIRGPMSSEHPAGSAKHLS